MKLSTRAKIITLIVSLLAVVAGVVAVRAFANGSVTYCYNCYLGEGGTPAQSSVMKDFYYNDMVESSPDYRYNMELYNYYQGTKTCSFPAYAEEEDWTGWPTYPLPNEDSCIPNTVYSSARCHLLGGSAPGTEFLCWADYETAG